MHPTKNSYKCPVAKCYRNFEKNSSLVAHLASHCRKTNDTKKRYRCNICYNTFKHELIFKFHQKSHPDENPFKCDECSKAFTIASNLRRHKNNVHALVENRPFQCDICTHAFKTSSNLKTHKLWRHTTNRPFKCELCNASFKGSIMLKHHQIKHLKEKLIKCHQCDASFKTQKCVRVHVLRVHTDSSFECDICSAKFKIKPQIASHMVTHCKERPFKCQKCPSTFKSKVYLESHQATHETNSLYECSLCPSTYITKKGMQYHRKYVHSTDDYSCQCSICNKICRNPATLQSHLNTHKKLHRCDYDQCGKKFSVKYLLSAHIARIHQNKRNFKCELCLKCYSTKMDLKVHLRNHLLGSYKCDHCTNTYATKQNLQIHRKFHFNSKIELFTCDICLNTFSHMPMMKAQMTNHIRQLKLKL